MQYDHLRRDRIYALLESAARADPQRKQFGSEKHQYHLNPPIEAEKVRALENQYGFQLPEDYFWFITQVGNGGAGPNYGLYPFGEPSQEYAWLKYPRTHGPKASRQAYDAYIDAYEEACEEADEAQYESMERTFWQGLLTIGTAGCTYDMMLVVTGEERGRILHIDLDLQRPYFSPDASFLDWYERWLEETAAGCQMRGFNERIGGDAWALLAQYPSAEEKVRADLLNAMYKFVTLPQDCILKLHQLYQTEQNLLYRGVLLQLLSRFGFAQIDQELHAAAQQQAMYGAVVETLWGKYYDHSESFHHGKWDPAIAKWYKKLLQMFPVIAAQTQDSHRPFFTCLDLLMHCPNLKIRDIAPYFNLENWAQRASVFYRCSEHPMPHTMVKKYVQRLQQSRIEADYTTMRECLQACMRIGQVTPKEKPYLERELVPFCMEMLCVFARESPRQKDAYIENNVYQALECFGKKKQWVETHL